MADEMKQKKAAMLWRKAKVNKDYEIDDSFKPYKGENPEHVKTVADVFRLAESGKAEVEGRVMVLTRDGKFERRPVNSAKEFIEMWKKTEKIHGKMRESFAYDSGDWYGGNIGQEFIPILGGPFYKQLYPRDYMRMHNLAFYAANFDPIGAAIVNITVNFTLGRGFRVDSRDKNAQAIWAAFEKANNLQEMFEQLARELCTYGEVMLWKLPNNQTAIEWQLRPDQRAPKGKIPRVRLFDPSNVYDIVTFPEDIQRVINYTVMAPTQYQTFTDKNNPQPTSKFIFDQIPAEEINHYKVNVVSNEKRGRSDLQPVIGFLKRLRDSVQYSIIGLQKQSAWTIDTAIEGSQTDIDAYNEALANIEEKGQVTPGSEFVHTNKVTRQFLTAPGASAGANQTFEWVLSCICAGSGIPFNYLGTSIGGAATRATAVVGSEPVAKKFEMRQAVYERIIRDLWDWLMELNGIEADCEVTFPELQSQDKLQKIQAVSAAMMDECISHEQGSNIIAKELSITNYDYDETQRDIASQKNLPGVTSPAANPLTTASTSGLTSTDKGKIKDAGL